MRAAVIRFRLTWDSAPRRVHVSPAWETHVLEGLDCPCRPRLKVACRCCAGEGCDLCGEDKGWVFVEEPAPDEPLVIIHNSKKEIVDP